jgi:hypothetical protein
MLSPLSTAADHGLRLVATRKGAAGGRARSKLLLADIRARIAPRYQPGASWNPQTQTICGR